MAVLVSLQELRGSWMGYKGAAALEDTRNDPGEPGGPSERACLAEALQQPTSAVAGEPRRANAGKQCRGCSSVFFVPTVGFQGFPSFPQLKEIGFLNGYCFSEAVVIITPA